MARTREEFETIVKICERAEAMNISAGERFTLIMDLEKTHETVGLRLNELLAAEDYDFAHDVIGIQNHMNRSTGQLEDFFLPRYAKQHGLDEVLADATEKSKESGKEQGTNRDNLEREVEQ